MMAMGAWRASGHFQLTDIFGRLPEQRLDQLRADWAIADD